MRVDSVIEIAASPATVWAVTIDVERWPEWAPMFDCVTRLDAGPFTLGSAASIRQPGLGVAQWVVSELEPGVRFVWESRTRGMHMIATHALTETALGSRCTLSVELRGFVANVLWLLVRPSLRRSLERENAALKSTCESIERASVAH